MNVHVNSNFNIMEADDEKNIIDRGNWLFRK